MQVQCVLCDKIETLNDNSYEAKRLLNKRNRSHLCSLCDERIAKKTKQRRATGNFKLYESKKNKTSNKHNS